MNWFYAVGGQQHGPVDDGQLDALAAAGTITQDSLVWREGLANWQPLRQARPVAGAAPPVMAPPVTAPAVAAQPLGADEILCVECGNRFPKDSAMQFGAAWVCAGCKPRFIQKLREGAATGTALPSQGPFDPDIFIAGLRARDYRLEIGSCLSRGWETAKERFFLSVGVIGLIYLCIGAASVIPIIGGLIQLVIQGPLMGGLFWFFIKRVRKEEATVGDAFSGFSEKFLQMFLLTLVSGILVTLCMVPAIIAFIVAFFSGFSAVSIAVIVGASLLGIIPAIYLNVSWFFATPLVMDKAINFWPAMEVSRKAVTMHFWITLLLFLAVGAIVLTGVLAGGALVLIGAMNRQWVLAVVGGLAILAWFVMTAPFALAALMHAYDDVFGNPAH
jgi:hypothetical protein